MTHIVDRFAMVITDKYRNTVALEGLIDDEEDASVQMTWTYDDVENIGDRIGDVYEVTIRRIFSRSDP